MGARAQIGFLRDRGSFADGDFAQGVGISTITQAGAVRQAQFPRNLDTRPRMDKRYAADLGTKTPQHEESPGIEGLRRPRAEKSPSSRPEHDADPFPQAPRRRVG